MTMANENFSAETYLAYGCNCLMGDSVSANGHGPAIDEIDTTCKKYKGKKIKSPQKFKRQGDLDYFRRRGFIPFILAAAEVNFQIWFLRPDDHSYLIDAKFFTDCIKCVKMEFGEECINDDFRYRIRLRLSA